MDQMIRGALLGGKGTSVPHTATVHGAERVALTLGRYTDAALDRRVYRAANQAAQAWTVALATTYTGIVLSNPFNSGVNLVPLFAGFALSVAPAAVASIGFFGGYSPTAVIHTTPLDVLSTMLDQEQSTAVGKVDSAATLPGTPRWLLPFMGGFTAAALPATSPAPMDLGGIFVVPPGAYFGIAALTVVTGFGGLVWEEVPIVG